MLISEHARTPPAFALGCGSRVAAAAGAAAPWLVCRHALRIARVVATLEFR